MKKNKTIELKILKAVLWIYIILCFLIAGLNYGYASRTSASIGALITWFWHFYENWIKTLFIIICSVLTLRIVGASDTTTLRKRNLMGFIGAALVVHIVTPLFLSNKELYFFTMPLPWTTTPLQLMHPQSSFYTSRFPVWGAAGITAALVFYTIFSAIVIIGSLMLGRRWQCSTLCLFNGFASEVFAPAFPLIGKAKAMKPSTLRFFMVLKWIFLAASFFFTLYWILLLSGIPLAGNIQVIRKAEEYTYLSGELLAAMFFWVAFIGRGYCYYCPLGTVLGLLGRAAGQKVITGRTECIQCGKCNKACSMSVDIMKKAQEGEESADLRCVGCGHCVDACPTKTLAYSTRFLDKVNGVLQSGTAGERQIESKKQERNNVEG